MQNPEDYKRIKAQIEPLEEIIDDMEAKMEKTQPIIKELERKGGKKFEALRQEDLSPEDFEVHCKIHTKMHHLALKKEELSHLKAINNNAKDIQELFGLPSQHLDWDGPAKFGPDGGPPKQSVLSPEQLNAKRRALTKQLRDKFSHGELTQEQYEMMQEKINEEFYDIAKRNKQYQQENKKSRDSDEPSR